MKSFIAALRSLVLPYGRTSGQRIVLDGDNGLIAVYDATNTLAVLIQSASPAGITVYGPSGDFTVADADAVWQSNNGSRVEIVAGALQALMNLTPQDVGGITWADGAMATTISAILGANTPALVLQSPTDSAHVSKSTIRLHGGPPAPSGAYSNLIDITTQLMQVSGDFKAANIQSGSFSITPTVASQWTANLAVNFPQAFAVAPVVMVTPSGNGPGVGTTTELEFQTTGVTTTGFNCRIRRDNLSATTLSYLAVSTP